MFNNIIGIVIFNDMQIDMFVINECVHVYDRKTEKKYLICFWYSLWYSRWRNTNNILKYFSI